MSLQCAFRRFGSLFWTGIAIPKCQLVVLYITVADVSTVPLCIGSVRSCLCICHDLLVVMVEGLEVLPSTSSSLASAFVIEGSSLDKI